MNKYVYLAGPIANQTVKQANEWREYVALQLFTLSNGGIRGISPLRCEPDVNGVYNMSYSDDIKFGTAHAIANKNYLDVQQCDLTLAYLPIPSIGTLLEIGWADALRKPIVIVSENNLITAHPILNCKIGWILPTFDDAIDVITGLLNDYT